MCFYWIKLKRIRLLLHLTQYLVLTLLTLSVWNHTVRLQGYHFLDLQIYSKGFVNNKPVFDRKLTFIDCVSQFSIGIRMITLMLAGIRNRRSGLNYCNVMDTWCFYEITSSTQPTCITIYVYNGLKWLLRLFFSLSILIHSWWGLKWILMKVRVNTKMDWSNKLEWEIPFGLNDWTLRRKTKQRKNKEIWLEKIQTTEHRSIPPWDQEEKGTKTQTNGDTFIKHEIY